MFQTIYHEITSNITIRNKNLGRLPTYIENEQRLHILKAEAYISQTINHSNKEQIEDTDTRTWIVYKNNKHE